MNEALTPSTPSSGIRMTTNSTGAWLGDLVGLCVLPLIMLSKVGSLGTKRYSQLFSCNGEPLQYWDIFLTRVWVSLDDFIEFRKDLWRSED